jgi:hypothetical protein
MDFTVNIEENFQTSSFVHSINTRNKHHLHRPNPNSSCFHKNTFSAGIRIFNSLPCRLTSIEECKTTVYKVALRRQITKPFFYSVDEFLGTFTKLRKPLLASACLSAHNNWAPTG